MDPNACLKEIRVSLMASDLSGVALDAGDAARLGDLIDGLDQWICKEGFLPNDWENAQRRRLANMLLDRLPWLAASERDTEVDGGDLVEQVTDIYHELCRVPRPMREYFALEVTFADCYQLIVDLDPHTFENRVSDLRLDPDTISRYISGTVFASSVLDAMEEVRAGRWMAIRPKPPSSPSSAAGVAVDPDALTS